MLYHDMFGGFPGKWVLSSIIGTYVLHIAGC